MTPASRPCLTVRRFKLTHYGGPLPRDSAAVRLDGPSGPLLVKWRAVRAEQRWRWWLRASRELPTTSQPTPADFRFGMADGRLALARCCALTGRHDEARALLDEIRDYNLDDCVSTWQLREWLLEHRDEEAVPRAEQEADRLQDQYIGTEHLLLGVAAGVGVGGSSRGPADVSPDGTSLGTDDSTGGSETQPEAKRRRALAMSTSPESTKATESRLRRARRRSHCTREGFVFAPVPTIS